LTNLREQKMPHRILTSHVGSLPRPDSLIALSHRRLAIGQEAYDQGLADAVAAVASQRLGA
jgi:methionine synthase II (cobalamin-independent)